MSKFARQNVRKLKPYVPGEQPAPGTKVIKLNTNENPYAPSPAVRATLRSYAGADLRKYPQPHWTTFRQAAARTFKIDPENIFAGNGSDEVLNLIVRAFVEPGEKIAYPVPTYSLYPVLARIQEAQVVEVPFGERFDLPAEGLLASGAKLAFIANPNAPTGTMIEPAAIEAFARRFKGLVVVDEAYVDFAEANCLPLVGRNGNIIVSRTLSKSYSLAGLRFGFAVASKPIVEDLMKIKDSYNCDALAIELATRAVEDQSYMRRNADRIRRQRAWLTNRLTELGFAVMPSQANFVWATRARPAAKAIYQDLKARGILVRYFDQGQLRRGLRITVGLPQENRALIAALREILA
ncbi:MAG: histidinol-phosphate transaminase [Phycisphaerae bacterium]|nr:histidinol-phosphate transaminase [Phycisphaerae bacterium]